MADRKPLVVIDGSLSEIPAGDTLDATVKNADLLDGLDSSEFALTNHIHDLASLTRDGFMSKDDKYKLENIEEFADKTDFENVRDAGAVMRSSFNSKGDLLVGTADNNFEVFPRGHEGYVLVSSDASHTGLSWVFGAFGTNWGEIEGDISNQTDLNNELLARYIKSDYINKSDGAIDAGKPIVLNAQGQVDPSMVEITAFHYVDNWTPTTTDEYPNTAGETDGAFWVVQGLSPDYTFNEGDLQWTTVSNGDFMVWSSLHWSVIHSTVDPSIYYRLDGTQAIISPFAGGGQQFKNAAEGTDDTDLVTLSQLNQYSPTLHTHDPADIVPQGHSSTLNADMVDGFHGDQLFKSIGGTVYGDVNVLGQFKASGTSILRGTVLLDKEIVIGLDNNNDSIIHFRNLASSVNSILWDNTDNELKVRSGNISGRVWTEFNLIPSDFSPVSHVHHPTDIVPQGHLSTLDADTLDGKHADEISMTDQEILEAIRRIDGHGSEIDADMVDGIQGAKIALKDHFHTISDTYTLEDELLERYKKIDFIKTSAGPSDAHKPIVLDNNGRIDPSMLTVSTFYYVGPWEPTPGREYPDTTGETPGAFWLVSDLDSPYTFLGGDLFNKVTKNGDLMLWASNGWGLMETALDPTAYYKLDGTLAITADFNAGNYKISHVKDGEYSTDGVNLRQLYTRAPKVHNHEPADIYPQGHLSTLDADTLDGKHDYEFASNLHGHFINEVYNLQDELDSKENFLEFPTVDGLVLSSTAAGQRSWIPLPNVTTLEWGNITGNLVNQTDLQAALDAKTEIGHLHQIADVDTLNDELLNRFTKAEHISYSVGPGDIGRPIILNAQGQIDPSMLDFTSFYFVGNFTPQDGMEYPDTTGESHGAFWVVQGLSSPYTFMTGDLSGTTIDNGDNLVWGTNGWAIIRGDMNPDLYYKLDGTQAITAPFACGNQQFKNAADGTTAQDLITLKQLTSHHHSGVYLPIDGKAADSDLLDGLDSTAFARESHDHDSIYFRKTGGDISGNTRIHASLAISDYFSIHDVTDDTIGRLRAYYSSGLGVFLQCLDASNSIVPGEIYINSNLIWNESNFDPDDKEDDLGNPTVNGYVLSSDTAGNRSWVAGGGVGSIEWGDITGDIINQVDLQAELDAKSNTGHTHTESEISDLDKYTQAETNDLLDNKSNIGHNHDTNYAPISHDHTESDITDLDKYTQTEVDGLLATKSDTGHNHNSDYYLQTQFIETSVGLGDAGKPIVLNAQGQIDPSLLDVSTFYYVGNFTPDATLEYPDTTGETHGAFWAVQGLTADYEFTTGDLAGKTVSNGDFMVWAAAGWSIMAGEMNPMLYYKLDGTQAISAPFAGGSQQFKNAADGTDATDLITKGQLDSQTHVEADITDLDKYTQAEVDSALSTKENDLDIPDVDGQVLSSLIDGTRSWITLPTSTTLEWGNITGTLANQTDLQGALDLKLNLSGGTLTGPLTISAEDEAILLTGQARNFIRGLDETGADLWFIGRGSASSKDISFENYLGSQIKLIEGGGVNIDDNQIWHAGNFNPTTKEDFLDVPTTDGQVLSSLVDGTRSWIDPPASAVWGSITGTLFDQTDLQIELDAKVSRSGDTISGNLVFTDNGGTVRLENPDHGYVYGVDNAGNDGWYFGRGAPGSNNVNLSNYNGSQLSLPEGGGFSVDGDEVWHEGNFDPATKSDTGHHHDSLYYRMTQFINFSDGVDDAGKPVVLDSQGQIDPSMLDVSIFYYIGPFTPVAGTEYPDPTGEEHGAFWVIQNVDADDGYTFTTGDLAGKNVTNGDFLVWSAAGWSIMAGEMNPMLYYKLDGSQPITADFQAGGFKLAGIADGTNNADAVNKGQLNTKESILGNPSTDGYILSSTAAGVRSWIAPPTSTSATWGNITGTLANQTDLQDALDLKSDTGHNHSGVYLPIDGKAADSDLLDGLDSGAFAPTSHSHSQYLEHDGSVAISGDILPNADNTLDFGSSSEKFANIYATDFRGQATSALYADLAEKYTIDEPYEIGDVVLISPRDDIDAEIANRGVIHTVLGVVSENPAFKMNEGIDAPYIALRGRVKCKVFGKIRKGDRLVSWYNGCAIKHTNGFFDEGIIFAKALENKLTNGEGLIEVVIL